MLSEYLKSIMELIPAGSIVFVALAFLFRTIINHLLDKDVSTFKAKIEANANERMAQFQSELEREKLGCRFLMAEYSRSKQMPYWNYSEKLPHSNLLKASPCTHQRGKAPPTRSSTRTGSTFTSFTSAIRFFCLSPQKRCSKNTQKELSLGCQITGEQKCLLPIKILHRRD